MKKSKNAKVKGGGVKVGGGGSLFFSTDPKCLWIYTHDSRLKGTNIWAIILVPLIMTLSND